MTNLDEMLAEATSAIEHCYYFLPIDGGEPIYRERVYCYELYHQMRTRWPGGSQFVLNGEVDKSAHPILKQIGIKYAIPDFLVHSPGDMAGNHAIIEVKSARGSRSRSAIRKDLETLKKFRMTAGYRRGIYLFYGYDASIDLTKELASAIDMLPTIELWLHSGVGIAASRVGIVGSD